jgi:hypothetical protein
MSSMSLTIKLAEVCMYASINLHFYLTCDLESYCVSASGSGFVLALALAVIVESCDDVGRVSTRQLSNEINDIPYFHHYQIS